MTLALLLMNLLLMHELQAVARGLAILPAALSHPGPCCSPEY